MFSFSHRLLCGLIFGATVIVAVNLLARSVIRLSEWRGMISRRTAPSKARLLGRTLFADSGLLMTFFWDVRDCICLFSYKVVMYGDAILHLVISNELRGLNAAITANECQDAGEVVLAERKVYLLRHGESVWNLIFNRGPVLAILPRLIVALLTEVLLFCEWDSVIIDSPLSMKGLNQCADLLKWTQKEGEGPGSLSTQDERQKLAAVLRGDAPGQFCTSNLRRSISSLVAGKGSRVGADKIAVLSCLQEATRNVDGASIASGIGRPQASVLERCDATEVDFEGSYGRLDYEFCRGNKGKRSSLVQRQNEFMAFLFRESTDNCVNQPMVAAGHSLYFKNLLRRFMQGDHAAKRKKIANCGICAITAQKVRRSDGSVIYRVPNGTFLPLYMGLVDL